MQFDYFNRTDSKGEGWGGKQASIWDDANEASNSAITGHIVVGCPRNGTDAEVTVHVHCLDQAEAEAIAEFLVERARETKAAALRFREARRGDPAVSDATEAIDRR